MHFRILLRICCKYSKILRRPREWLRPSDPLQCRPPKVFPQTEILVAPLCSAINHSERILDQRIEFVRPASSFPKNAWILSKVLSNKYHFLKISITVVISYILYLYKYLYCSIRRSYMIKYSDIAHVLLCTFYVWNSLIQIKQLLCKPLATIFLMEPSARIVKLNALMKIVNANLTIIGQSTSQFGYMTIMGESSLSATRANQEAGTSGSLSQENKVIEVLSKILEEFRKDSSFTQYNVQESLCKVRFSMSYDKFQCRTEKK